MWNIYYQTKLRSYLTQCSPRSVSNFCWDNMVKLTKKIPKTKDELNLSNKSIFRGLTKVLETCFKNFTCILQYMQCHLLMLIFRLWSQCWSCWVSSTPFGIPFRRALPDITSGPEVRQIFKIRTVRKPDITLPGRRTVNPLENRKKNKKFKKKFKKKIQIFFSRFFFCLLIRFRSLWHQIWE